MQALADWIESDRPQLLRALQHRFPGVSPEDRDDAIQDAVARALTHWPKQMPDNPAAWLAEVSRNRLLDGFRRSARWKFLPEDEIDLAMAPQADAEDPDDSRWRAVQVCCDNRIPQDAQVALALRYAFGFGLHSISRLLQISHAASAQLLSRAKSILRQRVRWTRSPEGRAGLTTHAVAKVLYLGFTEGYFPTENAEPDDDLCQTAIALTRRLCAEHSLAWPEFNASLALMLFHWARTPARAGAQGVIPLPLQDRTKWDQELIREAVRHLHRSASGNCLTRYHLEAEIAATHALAPSIEATDWRRIADCYDALWILNPSPVVRRCALTARGKTASPPSSFIRTQSSIASLPRKLTEPPGGVSVAGINPALAMNMEPRVATRS